MSQSPPVGTPSSCAPFQVDLEMGEEAVTSIIQRLLMGEPVTPGSGKPPQDKAGGILASRKKRLCVLLLLLLLPSPTGLSFGRCNEVSLLEIPCYTPKMLLEES